MTARPPSETLDAAPEESFGSPAEEAPHAPGQDDPGNDPGRDARKAAPGDGEADEESNGSNFEHREASVSKTLDAILSRNDGDAVRSSSHPLGTKTLMGVGVSGVSAGSFSGDALMDVDEMIPVDDLFEDADELGQAHLDAQKQKEKQAAGPGSRSSSSPPPPTSEDTQVTSLLDEVAHALNAQASETRERARGRLPGAPPVAARPPRPAPIVSAPAMDLEFEDPDDGPTGLGLEATSDQMAPGRAPGRQSPAAAQRRQDGGDDLDDEVDDIDDVDEAVVLGPARKTGGRAVAAPPLPGRTGSTAAAIGPPPGLAPRIPTPFAGLPAATLPVPGSGRVRLPTPVPGHSAPALPTPNGGRSTLPLGTPSPLGGADISAGSTSKSAAKEKARGKAKEKEEARRTAARSVTPHSGAVPVSLGSQLGERLAGVTGALSAILKASFKVGTMTLTGLGAVTFAAGLLIGRSVWKTNGAPTATASAPNSVGGPAGSAADPTDPSHPTPPGNSPNHVTAASAPSTLGATAGTAPLAAPVVEPTPPPAAPVVAPIANSDADGSVNPPVRRAAGARRARRAANAADLFPKTAAETSKPPAGPPRAAGPANAPKAPAANTSKPTVANASKPVVANASKPTAPHGKKAKPAWHDPFAD